MSKRSQNSPEESAQMRDTAVNALEDAKGVDIRTLDVRKLTDITDYMIVVSGTSERHVRTLAERVSEFMLAAGWKPLGIEGEDAGEWVLSDFVDVVVHIMREKTRAHYDLESLWDETLAGLGGAGELVLGDSAADGS